MTRPTRTTRPTRAGRRAALLVGSVATLLVGLTATASVACDPPYILDEETGELDQEAWDAGVEECARWEAERSGSATAERVAPVAAGAAILGFGLWARPRRNGPVVGDAAWYSNAVPRLWWALALAGVVLMASPLFAALS